MEQTVQIQKPSESSTAVPGRKGYPEGRDTHGRTVTAGTNRIIAIKHCQGGTGRDERPWPGDVGRCIGRGSSQDP